MTGLTDEQRELAALLFSLPQAGGYVLAAAPRWWRSGWSSGRPGISTPSWPRQLVGIRAASNR